LTRADQSVVITLGERGAAIVTLDRTTLVPGRPVVPIDTTGAGDCFLGAMAAQLVSAVDLDDAVRFANVAASLCVQRIGAGSSMPTTEEIAAATA